MGYRFRLPDDPSLEVTIDNTWMTRVRANGQDLQRASEKGRPYLIPRADGSARRMVLKVNFFDPSPKAIVDGREIALAPPLAWYAYVLGCLPLLLLFVGGALGGLSGGLGTMLNLNVLRSERSSAAKAGLLILITLGSVVAYTVLAIVFQMLIGR